MMMTILSNFILGAQTEIVWLVGLHVIVKLLEDDDDESLVKYGTWHPNRKDSIGLSVQNCI